ncbi:hypothetical protein C8F04DRAFT_1190940 [Mycena alexandri]|uniref:Uncharacterized protein n=1 Tax=Mycena alexandri TaxID=1745969 RepID=A0AAD6SEG2_9AGAR|nr:hypothetical protein C8F04DRAFT_1190940 [Mycena alexandri]
MFSTQLVSRARKRDGNCGGYGGVDVDDEGQNDGDEGRDIGGGHRGRRGTKGRNAKYEGNWIAVGKTFGSCGIAVVNCGNWSRISVVSIVSVRAQRELVRITTLYCHFAANFVPYTDPIQQCLTQTLMFWLTNILQRNAGPTKALSALLMTMRNVFATSSLPSKPSTSRLPPTSPTPLITPAVKAMNSALYMLPDPDDMTGLPIDTNQNSNTQSAKGDPEPDTIPCVKHITVPFTLATYPRIIMPFPRLTQNMNPAQVEGIKAAPTEYIAVLPHGAGRSFYQRGLRRQQDPTCPSQLTKAISITLYPLRLAHVHLYRDSGALKGDKRGTKEVLFTLLRTLSMEVVYLAVYRGHHVGKGGHFTLLRTLSVEVVYLVVYRGHHEGNGGHFTLLRTLSVEVVYLVVYRGHHVGKGGQKCRWGIWRCIWWCMGDTMGVKGDRSIGRHSGRGTGFFKVKCTSFGALSECHKVIDDGLKALIGALGLCEESSAEKLANTS